MVLQSFILRPSLGSVYNLLILGWYNSFLICRNFFISSKPQGMGLGWCWAFKFFFVAKFAMAVWHLESYSTLKPFLDLNAS